MDFALDYLLAVPGPRFFAGDWNFEIHELSVCAKLRSAGWVEVQDLLHSRTGAPVRLTCKAATRKDYLWLSPDLALAFLGLNVDFDTFADHAVLVAQFQGGPHHLARFVWPCPKPIPWQQVPDSAGVMDFQAPADPTAQYAALWSRREETAKIALAGDWISSMRGRGQQTKPRRVTGRPAPIKQGRSSDVQPLFFGFSVIHTQRFKQVCRLQNFCRWADNHANGHNVDSTHGIDLWNSVLRAPGFAPTFSMVATSSVCQSC